MHFIKSLIFNNNHFSWEYSISIRVGLCAYFSLNSVQKFIYHNFINRTTTLSNMITVKRLIKRFTLTRSNSALRSILAIRAKFPESSALLWLFACFHTTSFIFLTLFKLQKWNYLPFHLCLIFIFFYWFMATNAQCTWDCNAR